MVQLLITASTFLTWKDVHFVTWSKKLSGPGNGNAWLGQQRALGLSRAPSSDVHEKHTGQGGTGCLGRKGRLPLRKRWLAALVHSVLAGPFTTKACTALGGVMQAGVWQIRGIQGKRTADLVFRRDRWSIRQNCPSGKTPWVEGTNSVALKC